MRIFVILGAFLSENPPHVLQKHGGRVIMSVISGRVRYSA